MPAPQFHIFPSRLPQVTIFTVDLKHRMVIPARCMEHLALPRDYSHLKTDEEFALVAFRPSAPYTAIMRHKQWEVLRPLLPTGIALTSEHVHLTPNSTPGYRSCHWRMTISRWRWHHELAPYRIKPGTQVVLQNYMFGERHSGIAVPCCLVTPLAHWESLLEESKSHLTVYTTSGF